MVLNVPPCFIRTEHPFCFKYWQPTKICRSQGYLEICAKKVVDGFSTMNDLEKKIALIHTYQDFQHHNSRLQRVLDSTATTIGIISITPFLSGIIRIIIASVTHSTAVPNPINRCHIYSFYSSN